MDINKGDIFSCIKDVPNPVKGAEYKNIFNKWNVYRSYKDGYIRGCDGLDYYCVEAAKGQLMKIREDNTEDRVLHPTYYTWLKELCGVEVIDITRHMNFNLGNTLKYVLRAGRKTEKGMTDKEKQIEDLKKAAFYIDDEIKRLEKEIL